MLAIASKARGLRSLVCEMKLPAALFTSPSSGPVAQICSTISSTAVATRMSTAWVSTRRPGYLAMTSFAVSSSTLPRRPQMTQSAPNSTNFSIMIRPRPVPPPVTRKRFPLNRSVLNIELVLPCW